MLFLPVLLLLLPGVTAFLNPVTNRATNAISSTQYLSNAYILELDLSTPGLVKRDSTPDSILEDVLTSVGRNGIKYQLRHRFISPTLFHGASITVPPGISRSQIASLRGIKRVWPVRKFSRPSAVVDADGGGSGFSGSPIKAALMGVKELGKRANAYAGDTFGPHVMTGVNETHEAGLLGAGIKIGVLDTGVDYLNPILGGCFGPGCHMSFGYDLVGDDYDGDNAPVPDVDPFASCDPHGTHVTGIIGALPNAFGFTGVAPAATLGHYRVFGCTGFVGEDIILAGLMRGVEDNCNVLTLSLGGPGGWVKGTPASILIDQIEAQGILVTVATGNSGAEGMFFSESPASTINGLSIASTDVTDLIAYNATVSGQPAIPYLSATPLNVVANSFRVHFTSTDPNNPVDACSPLPAGAPDFANYVTVVQRGTCTFVTKYQNVLNAGGKIVLLYNSEGAGNLPYLTPNGVGIDAVAGLRRSDGLKLLSYYQNANKRLTLRFPKGKIVAGLTDTITGGLISGYSTFGPTNDLYGQPTLSAPGGNILSTFPLSEGGVAVISGTSMSCPFVAGSAAVLMAARASENLTPLEIRSLLTTTAKLTPVSLLGSTPLVSVIRQGGGLVQVAKALAAKTLISPHELLLNDTANANYVQTIKIKNTNSWAMKYTFSSAVAQGLGTFDASGDILPTLDPVAVSGAQATVAFNTRILSVAPGATGSVVATITPPVLPVADAARFPIFSGWIRVNGQGARDSSRNEAYTVPYFGLAAKMIDMQVLDTTETIYGPGYAYPFVIDDAIGDIQSTTTSYSRNLGPTVFARFATGTLHYSLDLVLADIAFTPTYPNSSPATRFVKRSLTQHTSAASHLAKRRVSIATINPKATLVADRQLHSDVPIEGNIFTQPFTGRDYLVDAAPTGSTDRTVTFNGQYAENGLVRTAVTGTSYRFLLRALKISGDAMYEDQYESWLSLPFSFRA
uniref:Subtilisin-like serine protease n=1 Tax=Glaciozyma antarctica TaxID=105987 RepID=B3WFP4_9BASI|nr:subtilisin-like serine protease precursor [Glaciozyma antarctica]